MQKKHLNKARRARTGMTGKAGKAGTQGTADRPENTGIAGKVDTLTPEQRRAKRLRDRKYRARKRAAERAALAQGRTVPAAEVETSAAPASSAKAGHPHAPRRSQCRKCGRCGRGLGPTEAAAGVPEVPEGVFTAVGRLVLSACASKLCGPASKPVQVERGVVRQAVAFPDGRRAVVTVVDGDEVDPLSPNSPLPWPIRRHLLLRRMAREISGIVDSHLECS